MPSPWFASQKQAQDIAELEFDRLAGKLSQFLTLSPDGKLLAVTSSAVRLVDASSGAEVRSLSAVGSRPRKPAWPAAVLEAPTRVRWVGQKEAADCGPACLAMLAHYFGLPVGADEVRSRVNISAAGATLGELLRAAASLGLAGQTVRVGAGQMRHVHVPAIVHLAGNHYVVLVRLDANGVLVGDPATGLVTVSVIHFVQTVSGSVLLLRPQASPVP